MVKLIAESTSFSIVTQNASCNLNINITIGCNIKPATVNIYGRIQSNIENYTTSNLNLTNFIGIGTAMPTHPLHIYSSSPINNNYESGGVLLDNQGISGNTVGETGITFRNNKIGLNAWIVGTSNNGDKLLINYGLQQNNIESINIGAPAPTIVMDTLGRITVGSNVVRNNANKLQVTNKNPIRVKIPYANDTGIKFLRTSDNTVVSSILPDTTNGDLIFKNIDGPISFLGFGESCRINAFNGNIGIGQSFGATQELEIRYNTYFANVGIGISNSTQRFAVNGNTYITGNVGIGTTVPLYALHLSSDSAFKPTTNTWSFSSDSRLKENITVADLDFCWNTIKTIPLKKYSWKTSNESRDSSKLGWIAQDVEKVFPNSIQIKEAYNFSDCKFLNTDELYASMYGALKQSISRLENINESIQECKKYLIKH